MRSWCSFGGGFLLVLFLVSGVNGFVDYEGRIVDRELNSYLDRLLSGHTQSYRADERRVKKGLIVRSGRDCLVLGSSRLMTVNSKILKVGDIKLVNGSVSGATIEDLYILGSLAIENGYKEIILGVSPWTLRKDEKKGWANLKRDYQRLLKADDLISVRSNGELNGDSFKKVKLLFDFDYFEANFKRLTSGGGADDRVSDSESRTGPEGEHLYSEIYKASRPGPIENVRGGYKLGRPFVSAEAESLLRMLLVKGNANGCTFKFVFIPYHPSVWTSSHKVDYAARLAIGEVESFILDLASEEGVPVYGNFDSRVFSLEHEDFYDAIHVKEEVLSRILSSRRLVVSD